MRKIFQLILGIGVLGLCYVIFTQISTPIKFEQEKDIKEKAVIERLKDVRLAEQRYKEVYGKYTDNFDTLINFVLHDSLTMYKKLVDEDDSVGMAQFRERQKRDKKLQNRVEYKIAVKDTVFSPRKTTEEVENLRFIPGTDNKTEFILTTNQIVNENKSVDNFIECAAPYSWFLDTVAYRQEIINLVDDLKTNYDAYEGVKFGSMIESNNDAGNWKGE